MSTRRSILKRRHHPDETNKQRKEISSHPTEITQTNHVRTDPDAFQDANQKSMLLSAGTYEGTLHCWKINLTQATSPSAALSVSVTPYFNAAHHAGQVRATCSWVTSAYIISGGADEKLFIYDGRRRRVLGDLLVSGEVTCLRLVGAAPRSSEDGVSVKKPTHCVAATTRGQIVTWNVPEWTPILVIDAHKRACHSIALHPHGLLGISVGSDRVISVLDWNRGCKALELKHNRVLHDCSFSPKSGEHYAVSSRDSDAIDVFDTSNCLLRSTFRLRNVCQGNEQCKREEIIDPVLSVTFVDERYLLCSMSRGDLVLWDMRDRQAARRIHILQEIVSCSESVNEDTKLSRSKVIDRAHTSVRCRDTAVNILSNPLTISSKAETTKRTLVAIVSVVTSCGLFIVWGLTRQCSLDGIYFLPIYKSQNLDMRFTCATSSFLE